MASIYTEPPYFPLTEQQLCCVPCAIQWILLRRGLQLVEQEIIGKELGLTIPKKYQHLFLSKIKISEKPKDWGCQQTEDNINKFFRKYKIPLKVKKIPYSEIKNPEKLIAENIQKGNDVVLNAYMSAIKPKEKYGHFVLVSELILGKKPRVVVGDPDFISKKFWEADLSKFIKGMSKEFDGEERGIYIFSKR